jgi:hypothetical protein
VSQETKCFSVLKRLISVPTSEMSLMPLYGEMPDNSRRKRTQRDNEPRFPLHISFRRAVSARSAVLR